MTGAIIAYGLVALIAFALGAIAENRARKADIAERPRDYQLTVSIGGQRRLYVTASHLALKGVIGGDVDLADGSTVQLAVEAEALS